ncbi:MAG: hypothetical protein ACYC7A_10615 [Thermoanaerobaculia bacterium]
MPESVVLSRGERHYFACELTGLLTRTVSGLEEDRYAELHRRRHVDLLTCLINPRDSRGYGAGDVTE